MKNLNKVLAMLVVFMMVVTTVAFGASFTDVAETSSYNTAIEVGTDLNLFKGYEDGTFKPEGEITRAEFAAIVVRMKGQEAQAAGAKTSTMFTDVPADHWAAGYVNIAVQAGIINGYGNGLFGPEDLVEYQDAITMMVRALGYEPAIGSAGYPTGYLTKAGDLGLTAGVNGVNGVAINRGAVAQIAFNALDVPLMTQSGYGTFTQYVINDGYSATTGTTNVKKTLLSENHSTVKVQGIVTTSSNADSASTTGLDTVTVNVTNALYNKFNIYGTEKMFVGASDALDYVGKKVIVFVEYNQFNDTCTIKSIYEAPASDTLVVDLADVKTVSGMTVTYYNENNRLQDVTLDSGLNIYINGVNALSWNDTTYVNDAPGGEVDTKSYKDSDGITHTYTELNVAIPANLLAKDGSVEFALLDPKNTIADYDTAYITVYETFVVDEVRASASRITNKITGAGLGRIAYDETDGNFKASLVDSKGAIVDWEDLSENDVLAVKYAKTGAKTIYEAEVVTNTVTGTVTGTDGAQATKDREIVVAGSTYDVAATVADSDIKLGDEGTFYLNKFNKVVYFDKSTSASGNYAYVLATKTAKDSFEDNQMKIVYKDGTKATYNLAKKVKVVTDTDIFAKDPTGFVSGTVAAYSNVEVKDITLSAIENTVVAVKINSSNEITTIETAQSNPKLAEDYFTAYGNDSGKGITDYDAEDKTFKFNGTRITVDESTVIFNYSTKDKEAEVVSLANMVDDQDFAGAYVYDLDVNDVAGCILLTNATLVGANDAAVFVVKASTIVDDEGNELTYITGYKNCEEVTYTAEAAYIDATKVALGKLYLVEFDANDNLKKLTSVTSASLPKDYTYVAGALKAIDAKKGYITIGSTDYKASNALNVYVYNENSDRVKYVVDESMNYLAYDSTIGVGSYGIYIDDKQANLKVDVELYLKDGKVVDMLYYIKK